MVFQSPLVVKYDNSGKPIGLAESNEVSVSAVSATTLTINNAVIQTLSAVSSNIAPDFTDYAFVINDQDFSGSPLNVLKVSFSPPSSTPLSSFNPGSFVMLADDGSSLIITPDSNVTYDNLDFHFGTNFGVYGNDIHWHLSTLNSYFVNTSGDTMTGNLNTPSVSANYFDFNLAAVTTAAEGRLRWSDSYKTFLIGGPNNIEMAAGQEVSIRVRNMTGSSMPKGSVVYVSGYNSNLPTVALASASSEAQTHKGLGVLKQTLGDGDRGLMAVYGLIEDIDLGTYTVGNILYLSLTPGLFTSSYAPAKSHPELIGTVIQNGANGVLFVHIQHGYELHEIHDVSRTDPSADGQVLVWNDTGEYYEPGSHNNLAGLTTGNPHTQYATLSGCNFTGTVSASTISATTYQNLPTDVRPLPFTIFNPTSGLVVPLFYGKDLTNINEIQSVLVGGTSASWSIYETADASDPEGGTEIIANQTTNSTTAGNNHSGSTFTENWVVLKIHTVSGAVTQFHLTLLSS